MTRISPHIVDVYTTSTVVEDLSPVAVTAVETIATFSSSGGLDIAAGKDLDSQYAHLDCVVFGNNAPLTENGTIYFNGTHFYGRISDGWVQLDN